MVHRRVVAAPRGRIRFDFILDGIRYRPSIKRPPSEANLRRARERLELIKHQIPLGTFSFADEFPDYLFLPPEWPANVRLCNDVFDDYLSHCEARLKRHDLATATVRSYRKILDDIWRPRIGRLVFDQVRYSRLLRIADNRNWSKKTYNNVISVLKLAFDFGYRDRPLYEDPARHLSVSLGGSPPTEHAPAEPYLRRRRNLCQPRRLDDFRRTNIAATDSAPFPYRLQEPFRRERASP